MSDLGEITALVHTYALLLDGGDMEAVTALFAHSAWRSERAGFPGASGCCTAAKRSDPFTHR